MAAATKQRLTTTKGKGRFERNKMAASVKIWAGTLVMEDSAGYMRPATDTAGAQGVRGLSVETVDNTGAAGAKTILYEAGHRVKMTGQSLTQALQGTRLTVVDDQTVGIPANTTNDVFAGTLDEFISSTECWLFVGKEFQA